jgi:hypothetical protein
VVSPTVVGRSNLAVKQTAWTTVGAPRTATVILSADADDGASDVSADALRLSTRSQTVPAPGVRKIQLRRGEQLSKRDYLRLLRLLRDVNH